MEFCVLPYTRNLSPTDVENYNDTFFLVQDTWNDFGVYTSFNLYSWINGDLKYIGIVKIGRFGLRKGKVNIPDSFSELSENYFSLGQSVDYYKYFAKLDDGNKYLTNLKDFILEANPERNERIQREEIFIKSLRRWDDNKAQTIEEYKNALVLDSEAEDYSFSYTCSEMVSLKFNVEKDSFPPTNLHALTGRNGVGKSKMLVNMVKAILGNYVGAKLIATEGFEDFSKIIHINLSPFSSKPIKEHSKLQYHCLTLNESSDNKSIKQFKEYMMLIGKADKFKLWSEFIEALNTDPILNSLNLNERIIEKDIFSYNTNRVLSTLFSELSDGHKSLLLIVSCLIAHVSERTIVFIDEPESHLHPPLVATLIRAIINILKKQNGVGIIVTHSPVVLQEIPKDCIWILNRHNDYITARRPLLETFAENINHIMTEQFGLQVLDSGFYQYIKEAVSKCNSESEALRLFRNRLGMEGKLLLRLLFLDKGDN